METPSLSSVGIDYRVPLKRKIEFLWISGSEELASSVKCNQGFDLKLIRRILDLRRTRNMMSQLVSFVFLKHFCSTIYVWLTKQTNSHSPRWMILCGMFNAICTMAISLFLGVKVL